MRWGIALLVALAWHGVARADPPATAVTKTIGDHAITTLAGCWESHAFSERWRFRKRGDHGLVVVRDVKDDSAARARIPSDVMFDPGVGNFGFAAAGRIHGALFVFVIDGDHLQAWPHWKPDGAGKGYVWSGNTMTLVPCRARGA